MSSPSNYDLDKKGKRSFQAKKPHGKRKHHSSKKQQGRTNHEHDLFQIDQVQKPHGSPHAIVGEKERITESADANYEAEKVLYDISGNEFLKGFIHRNTLPSLEPRVVQLTDHHHSFRFEVAPGSTSSLVLPEFASRELRSKFLELSGDNPRQLNPVDPIGKKDCEPIAPEWQLAYHPTCNKIHELSGGWQQLYRLPSELSARKGATDPESFEGGAALHDEAIGPDVHHREQIRLINHGAFRHVWMIRDAHDGVTKRAMKTLRSLKPKDKKFDLRNHDRHRRDAMSFEQLQPSPLVVDLYASCSSTAIFDYADRGDLLEIFKQEGEAGSQISELHLLQIAYNVSLSVHHAHHFDDQGRPTMAHTDIKADQFIFQDGHYKLSDFNRVRFLTWNKKLDKQCGFDVGKNGGEYRAPEEYAYQKETEKVDVYSLGNVLYFLLVREEVWKRRSHKEIYELVKKGQRPKIPDKIYNSDGIFEQSMIRAMERAWIHKPEDRASALQVANIIKEGIKLLSKAAEQQ